MKAIIVSLIVAGLYFFTLVLAKAAGMASREEERWAEEREQADKDDP